jgi:hypothetical protein
MGVQFAHGPLSLTLSHEGRGNRRGLFSVLSPLGERARERGSRKESLIFIFIAVNYYMPSLLNARGEQKVPFPALSAR